MKIIQNVSIDTKIDIILTDYNSDLIDLEIKADKINFIEQIDKDLLKEFVNKI